MDNQKKKLVAYFSCSGVTRTLAESLAAVAGADLYEIKPKTPYTAKDLDWMDETSRSSLEMKDASSRPEIRDKVSNMNMYDVVFVGFPIWWYVAPTIIHTFLESYDFSGKTIVPFCTSGSSGTGKIDEILKAICPDCAAWRPSKLLNGNPSHEKLSAWVDSLKL